MILYDIEKYSIDYKPYDPPEAVFRCANKDKVIEFLTPVSIDDLYFYNVVEKEKTRQSTRTLNSVNAEEFMADCEANNAH